MAPERLTRGELISATSAVVLLIFMFAFAWYGVDGIPRRPGSQGGAAGAETAWQGLTGVRWLMLLTILLALTAVAMHAAHPERQVVAAFRLALLALSTLTAALLVIRVLIDLPASGRVVDQKLGAIVGVIAGLGIAYGAWESERDQRARLLTTTLARRAASPPR